MAAWTRGAGGWTRTSSAAAPPRRSDSANAATAGSISFTCPRAHTQVRMPACALSTSPACPHRCVSASFSLARTKTYMFNTCPPPGRLQLPPPRTRTGFTTMVRRFLAVFHEVALPTIFNALAGGQGTASSADVALGTPRHLPGDPTSSHETSTPSTMLHWDTSSLRCVGGCCRDVPWTTHTRGALCAHRVPLQTLPLLPSQCESEAGGSAAHPLHYGRSLPASLRLADSSPYAREAQMCSMVVLMRGDVERGDTAHSPYLCARSVVEHVLRPAHAALGSCALLAHFRVDSDSLGARDTARADGDATREAEQAQVQAGLRAIFEREVPSEVLPIARNRTQRQSFLLAMDAAWAHRWTRRCVLGPRTCAPLLCHS